MYAKLFRRVIRITLTALVIVALCVAGVFTASYLERMNRGLSSTTEAYSRQFASGMDTVLGQSIYQTYRFILNDNGITDTLGRVYTNRSELLSLVNTLSAALASDQYYESVYLYTQKDDRILTITDAGRSYQHIDEMQDDELLSVLRRGMAATLSPRIVSRTGDVRRVVLPVAVPLGLNASSRASDCMLVTNIDVGLIFKTLLSGANIGSNAGVYITDGDGVVLIAADYSLIGRNVNELGYDRYPGDILSSLWSGVPACYRAVSPAGRQGWQVHMFVLEEDALGRSLNLSGALLALLAIGAMAFIILYIQLRRSMKPVSELARKSCCQDIKECMLQAGAAVQPAFPLTQHAYMLMLIRHPQWAADQISTLLEDDAVWEKSGERYVIPMNGALTAAALAVEDESEHGLWQAWAARRRPQLEEAAGGPVYIIMGSVRRANFPLAEAYHEVLLLNDHTMCLNGRRIVTNLDAPGIASNVRDYPVELEKQMINTLFAGDEAGFHELMGRFVQSLFDERAGLPNQGILQQLERWQNAVLAHAARIPVRLPGDICAAFDENDTEASALQKLSAFARVTAQYVRRHEEDRRANLGAEVRVFIDEHLAEPDFSFTAVSDRFSLSRGQLTAILKEQLGMGFADYVSEQRIERSKALLRDDALTVNDVAQRVGFTYPHYFIRVFKKREGITPGQFREALSQGADNIIRLRQIP